MKVSFNSQGWEDYLAWQATDPGGLAKLNSLLEECRRTPFRGTGKPEPLRRNLTGWWSRRITDEHRLVYRVHGSGEAQTLEVLQCRFHY